MKPWALLSVDPGDKGGWWLWAPDDDGPWAPIVYGQLLGGDVVDVARLLDLLAPRVGSWLDAHLVVEGQWFRHDQQDVSGLTPAQRRLKAAKQGAHFGAVQKLIESRCAWVDACRLAGIGIVDDGHESRFTVDVEPPGRWIPAMTRGAPGATPDDRIKFVARARWPRLRLVDGEHPAALLGAYWLQRHGFKVDYSAEPERWLPRKAKGK